MKNSITLDKKGHQLDFIELKPKEIKYPNPIILVHGAFHGAWMWKDNFLPFFADAGFHTLALNLRGRGQTRGLKNLSLKHFVEDITEAVRLFDAPPIFIAHSMGGLVVQKYLEQHVAKAAILISAVPPFGMYRNLKTLITKHPVDFMKFAGLFTHPLLTKFGTPPSGIYSDASSIGQIKAFSSQMNGESKRTLVELLRQKVDVDKVKRTPLLILGAEDDGLVFKEDVIKTAELYGLPYHIFDKMTHMFLTDPAWKNVADYILQQVTAHETDGVKLVEWSD